jgi:hypothetical protein
MAAEYFQTFPKTGFSKINIPVKTAVPLNTSIPRERIAQIGSRSFNMQFLTKMRQLPGLRVRIKDRAHRRQLCGHHYRGGGPMEFAFDGGEGMVMPTLAIPTLRIA